MLTSLILQLQAPTAVNLPASLGRASQALLLRLVAERDSGLARRLHDEPGPKPYTASNLVAGKRESGSLRLAAGQGGWLRFTGLSAEVSEVLRAVAADPPETVEVDGFGLAVTGATLDPAVHAWAGQVSYQDLAGPFLLGGVPHPAKQVRLEFVSPTSFRSGGHFVPLPLPELVFGSLLDKWQAFAPIALHPDTRRFAAEAVVLSRYALRTRGVPLVRKDLRLPIDDLRLKSDDLRLKSDSSQDSSVNPKSSIVNTLIGFSGQVWFAALNRDKYWLSVLHLLAAFAFFSGVGYQTGTGLGQTRQF